MGNKRDGGVEKEEKRDGEEEGGSGWKRGKARLRMTRM